MKLRNKKTGEITDLAKEGFLESDTDNHIIVYPEGTLKYYAYNSLAELNEEWEDYNPAEPLIKDEKIRKAVRAWWDCCQEGIEDKRIYIKDAEFRMGIYRLDLGRYYFFDDKKEDFYTLDELCGEEEE